MNRIASLLVVLLIASTATARFAHPTYAPVDRLMKNIAAYIEQHPDDAQGYYVLGRLHTLAFVGREARLGHYPGGAAALPHLEVPFGAIEVPGQGGDRGDPQPNDEDAELAPRPVTLDVLSNHLTLAIENLARAAEMSPKEAVYRNGLAYAYELSIPMAMMGELPAVAAVVDHNTMTPAQRELSQELWKAMYPDQHVGADGQPGEPIDLESLLVHGDDLMAVLHMTINSYHGNEMAEPTRQMLAFAGTAFRERTIAHYFAAYELSLAEDLARDDRPLKGLWGMVSYEAGHAYLRLVESRGIREDEAETVAQVKTNLAKLSKKEQRLVTPIVFSFERHARLSDLLAPQATVAFDLDGSGRPSQWNWVKPTTGILVWDPDATGQVTSGRQLFGTASFWMFWRNGYDALDALDNNRDGQLTDDELTGIAVWFDKNQNGISDAGEVRTVQTMGITSISTRATGTDGNAPANLRGMTMSDGRVLPTYDWMAEEK